MNQSLLNIQKDFIACMKSTNGVLGAWNFGSVLHGMEDAYSDVDIVFLLEGESFKQTEGEIPKILSKLCGGVLLTWEETFNSNAIISNSYLLKEENQIFQFDVVLLNNESIGDFMCRIHYTDLTEKDIIFDTADRVKQLCAHCPHGSFWNGKLERLIKTYLFFFHMTAKYLLRQDYFKLNHVMRTLYDTHASLLLTGYDAINWGGAENKLHFLPNEKQEHLKKYFCTDDFSFNKSNLWESMEWFEQDMRDVLEKKALNGNTAHFAEVKAYWKECTALVR